jgi:hypothetical protein
VHRIFRQPANIEAWGLAYSSALPSMPTVNNWFVRFLENYVYSLPAPPPRTRTKPMEVLCVGMPRSGTESLQHALLKLGVGGRRRGFQPISKHILHSEQPHRRGISPPFIIVAILSLRRAPRPGSLNKSGVFHLYDRSSVADSGYCSMIIHFTDGTSFTRSQIIVSSGQCYVARSK